MKLFKQRQVSQQPHLISLTAIMVLIQLFAWISAIWIVLVASLESNTVIHLGQQLAADVGKLGNSDVEISQDSYEKMLYFSKICALTYCISTGQLEANKTFLDGGCPEELDFCSNVEENPSINRTRVELVLVAEKEELGTGFVAVDHEREVVMLAFRGSSTRQDWFSDFEIYPTEYRPVSEKHYDKLVESGKIEICENCMIHKGFNRFIETLSKDFLNRVERIFKRYPGYKMVVTGHSLGAALASICGIELKLRGFNPLILTYATPKMFNDEMKDWVDSLFKTKKIHDKSVKNGELDMFHGYFRVIHLQDYIPMVPPGYKAAGLEIFISKPELPHEKEDLEYRAIGSGATWNQLPTNELTRSALRNGMSNLFHMDEHRKYFIMINNCSGF